MPWSVSKKIAFQFLFIYLILYCLPLEVFWPWQRLVRLIGTLLDVDATLRRNGSGDTAYHYAQLLCVLLLALAGALVWSLSDRKRLDHRRLYLGLRMLARLFLGGTLIKYGAVKLIQVQFPAPSLHRLLQPFGDASPMGLLWTFLGASAAYNVFVGGVEMLGGLFLFFRRTTLLGALISIAAMTQICALNFCYDVPAKLFSVHLLAMALFIAAEDASRLASLSLLNRAVPSGSSETVLQRPALLHAAALKLLLLSTVLGITFYGANSQRTMMIRTTPKVDPTKFQLLNRGFHWISDSPYNR